MWSARQRSFRGFLRNYRTIIGEDVLRDQLETIKREGRYRSFLTPDRIAGRYPQGQFQPFADNDPRAQRIVTSYCSNDYLSMGQHPVVISAMLAVLRTHGVGSGGTRNISGTCSYHTSLEQELASLHQAEKAVLFSSCFVANEAAISTLGKSLPGCVIFSDENNHASLIGGVRHSGCRKHIFRHNDVKHLASLLAQTDPAVPKIIVFESVYSMSGAVSPIAEICDLADQYGAMTFLDEVHAVGLYGPTGAGMADHLHVGHRPTIISGTLSKGFGVYGGYIATNSVICDTVRSCAPGFIFTSSIPPAVAAGALSSIRHLRTCSIARTALHQKAQLLKRLLLEANIRFTEHGTHIVTILIGDPVQSRRVSEMLLRQYGMYVQHINFPTVPRGTERLRITPGPTHANYMLHQLVMALKEVLAVSGRQGTVPVGSSSESNIQ
jgi:5-aminolevulinate synthase